MNRECGITSSFSARAKAKELTLPHPQTTTTKQLNQRKTKRESASGSLRPKSQNSIELPATADNPTPMQVGPLMMMMKYWQ
jgi:hypothetical protein